MNPDFYPNQTKTNFGYYFQFLKMDHQCKKKKNGPRGSCSIIMGPDSYIQIRQNSSMFCHLFFQFKKIILGVGQEQVLGIRGMYPNSFSLRYNKQGGERDNISSCDLNAAYQCTYEDGSCLQVVSLFFQGEKEEQRQRTQSRATRATPKMGHKRPKEQKVKSFEVSSPPPLSFPSTYTGSKVNLDQ